MQLYLPSEPNNESVLVRIDQFVNGWRARKLERTIKIATAMPYVISSRLVCLWRRTGFFRAIHCSKQDKRSLKFNTNKSSQYSAASWSGCFYRFHQSTHSRHCLFLRVKLLHLLLLYCLRWLLLLPDCSQSRLWKMCLHRRKRRRTLAFAHRLSRARWSSSRSRNPGNVWNFTSNM